MRLLLAALTLGIFLQANAAEKSPAKFTKGFNQGWFKNDYGNQWGEKFDEAEARRLLRLTRESGGEVFRIWLFEGLSPVRWSALQQKNLARFLAIAAEERVKIYPTLFDGNIFRFSPTPEQKDYWWNLLNDRYGVGQKARDEAIAPIAELFREHRETVWGVDLVNEVNALVDADWFDQGWVGARKFVKEWRQAIQVAPSSPQNACFSPARPLELVGLAPWVSAVPVTASFGAPDPVGTMLQTPLGADATDFYDFHLYNDDGAIPRFQAVKAYSALCGKPVYLGEFGQSSKGFDDKLQKETTRQFLKNAQAAGLAGALAWRLSDIRPGHNPEARFSFEAFGKLRPALKVFAENP